MPTPHHKTPTKLRYEEAGISSSDISVIAHNGDGAIVDKNRTEAGPDAGAGAGIGAVVGGAGGVLTGLCLRVIPGVGPVVAAGWLVATAVGAVGGTAVGAVAGGIIGSMSNAGVDERDANIHAEFVRRGGTLVAARVDGEDIMKAGIFLAATKTGRSLCPRGRVPAAGWQSFDETAPLYTAEEIEAERSRYR
ncbi:MAG: hypothetical protein JO032_04090 [Alphaproteobacteria bacterium]|nr:hypothetical protein [Alphaproteobacteria bacterium]